MRELSTSDVSFYAALVAAIAALSSCSAPAAVARECPAAPAPACPPAATVPESSDAGAALDRFLNAAQAYRFDDAYALLAGDLRARYTPARLAEDYGVAKGVANDVLARARIALARPPRVLDGGARAEFPIGDGKAVRLVLERDGWKVESLE